MNKKIVVTGTSGFIGSHLVDKLIKAGYTIIGTKRDSSNLWRCQGFSDQIKWVNVQKGNWINELIAIDPDCIVHTAWGGVSVSDRNNWSIQGRNLDLVSDLLYIAENTRCKQFIGLGSQAEYGYIDGIVNEQEAVDPTTAYGAFKLAASEMIRKRCSDRKINWQWLRLFSFYGEKEEDHWLIPSCIKRMLTDSEMDFTLGEQKYAYLYIEDLVNAIERILLKDIPSGIYNISGSNAVTIRSLIEAIAGEINPNFRLNFGAIPYRENQPMHIQGDVRKFENVAGTIDSDQFANNLKKTIAYYVNKYE